MVHTPLVLPPLRGGDTDLQLLFPKQSEMRIIVTKVREENIAFIEELDDCLFSIDPNNQLISIEFEKDREAS